MNTVRAITNRAILDIDWGSQGEDIEGERMGGKPAKAHILWYVCKAVAGLSSCLVMGFLQRLKTIKNRLTESIIIGKILQDGNTVESYHIEEKGFIVCMISKVGSFSTTLECKWANVRQPKAAPASASNTSSSSKAPATPVPVTAQTPTPPAAPAPALNTSAQDVPATPTPAPAGSTGTTTEGGTFNDPSALTLGSQRDAAVANMESMGFPRPDIDRAMRAAFFNPDRAVEYLLNVGINRLKN